MSEQLDLFDDAFDKLVIGDNTPFESKPAQGEAHGKPAEEKVVDTSDEGKPVEAEVVEDEKPVEAQVADTSDEGKPAEAQVVGDPDHADTFWIKQPFFNGAANRGSMGVAVATKIGVKEIGVTVEMDHAKRLGPVAVSGQGPQNW